MNHTPHHDWHWPVFEETLCGTMTDRERLGLPQHYVQGRLDAQIAEAYAFLYGLSRDNLLNLIASTHHTLAQRIAAGNLLALLGDPRIEVMQPAMVDIAGGDVRLGLDPDQVDGVMERFSGLGLNRAWIEKECPSYSASIQPFKIAKYPVTHQEYKAFLLDTAFPEIPSSWDFRRYPQERANHPVYTVSHAAAQAYALWLSAKTGRAFRLPTEAEWEWAAMGHDHREFPWGNSFHADFSNSAETGLFTTTAVGVFLEGDSPFGVSDMAGNVEEYVADAYAPYPNGQFVQDHLVDIHGQYHVARGGSFARFRDLLRTKRRHGHNPKSSTYAMGFRLAETPSA